MLGWLRKLFAGWKRQSVAPRQHYTKVACYRQVTSDPPPMHWAPCHPSTMRRFKASMTCPNGHGLTLRDHSIAATGEVSPSVVCPERGCTFHEFVRLDRWSFGELP